MADSCIYSKTFMLKAKCLDISKQIPIEIIDIGILIINKNYSFDTINHIAFRENWERVPEPRPMPINPWANTPVDSKKIMSILNKLTEKNYIKMVEETNTFNYTDPKIVEIMFKKIIEEPFFSDLYAKFCRDLIHLQPIIKEISTNEFSNNKHKNLCKFISELYKLGVIDSLDSFVEVLTNDLNEFNLEILCKIILTTGVKDPQFKDIIINLDSIKNTYSSRFRFMIMDVMDKFNE